MIIQGDNMKTIQFILSLCFIFILCNALKSQSLFPALRSNVEYTIFNETVNDELGNSLNSRTLTFPKHLGGNMSFGLLHIFKDNAGTLNFNTWANLGYSRVIKVLSNGDYWALVHDYSFIGGSIEFEIMPMKQFGFSIEPGFNGMSANCSINESNTNAYDKLVSGVVWTLSLRIKYRQDIFDISMGYQWTAFWQSNLKNDTKQLWSKVVGYQDNFDRQNFFISFSFALLGCEKKKVNPPPNDSNDQPPQIKGLL